MSDFSKITIAIDIQHIGKPHNPHDRGAVAFHKMRTEAYICLDYGTQLFQRLSREGFRTFLLSSGTYKQRALFANQNNVDLYLALHMNSSKVPPTRNQSIVEYSELAGAETQKIAQMLATRFEQRLPVADGSVRKIKRNARGWSCISWVKASALLLEPLFINHESYLTGLVTEAHLYLISDCILDTIKQHFRKRV